MTHQSSGRDLHVGIDAGSEGAWVDCGRVATSAACDASALDLSTYEPLRIGAGAIDTFNGRIRDLRLTAAPSRRTRSP